MDDNEMQTYEKDLQDYFRFRRTSVDVRLGRIFQEEINKLGFDGKKVRLVISKPLTSIKNLYKTTYHVRKITAEDSPLEKGSYLVQISEGTNGRVICDTSIFRKICKHELYHISAGDCDFSERLANYTSKTFANIITPFRNVLADINANRYANKK